ncbi:transcriptional regulator, AraC family [Catenulispora acidiphila DSM 44928]|uniref:Transcriptional regulator, AraC family n=1 Tax=Catenulispora acidiphila (strain DSM 44928 / JCM 14897 / NBRC 102108 / NRRL B-24433 / ID139908) TaxID=479433 RepID=C7QGU2_CATAD|nr:AraC family transcriptional regulator [Catenulispora acidiphila]ACU74972.1 transcriptional regulator, AraC family [Catenulispora acidiphila DSM 44928]
MAGTRGWAEYWRDDSRGLEAMHARFRDHVYAPHSHDAYSFGVTDAGAQQFHCRGGLHTSAAGMVMVLNPDDPHDGRAAADLGYHYRIVHVSPQIVRAVLADAADLTDHADPLEVAASSASAFAGSAVPLPLFTRPVLGDRRLADAIAGLHAALAADASPLARDERLRAVILGAHLRGATRPPRIRTLNDGAQREAAHRARTLMREAYPEPLPVEVIAEAAGCSRFALYRAFSAEFGMSPSDYERQLRLRHARSLLAAGSAPADVAAATGFADQAHLARWFKRAYGITPGVFARGSGS